jgi:hypothetical protein
MRRREMVTKFWLIAGCAERMARERGTQPHRSRPVGVVREGP